MYDAEWRAIFIIIEALFFFVSFLASVVGAICGIGGGTIIKPALDMLEFARVSTISFLSGCTVLSMSCYSVVRNLVSGDNQLELKTSTPLAISAAMGGMVGNQLFTLVRGLFENQNTVGAVQAGCLAVITLATFVYTICKARIRTRHIDSVALCLVIGFFLGILSSFLGIGGGPINLVVLSYFFSMNTKAVAQNSLYVILFSQISSLGTTLVTHSIPEFEPLILILMVAGGIGGGIVGRIFYRRMDNKTVDKLFLALMVIIIAISIYNTWSFRKRQI